VSPRLIIGGLIFIAALAVLSLLSRMHFPNSLTNEQIIQAFKTCEGAGLKGVPLKNVESEIWKVQCEPK
jgi:hypothetical protein